MYRYGICPVSESDALKANDDIEMSIVAHYRKVMLAGERGDPGVIGRDGCAQAFQFQADVGVCVCRRLGNRGDSARHKWVSRANARDAWLARVSDDQILANIKACQLTITTQSHHFLKSPDSEVFLRAARAFTLQYPPVQRVEDVSERFEDLSDIPDADIWRMKEIRDAARAKNEQTNLEE